MPYFRCHQDAVHRTFVIELNDVALVKHARAVVAGLDTKKVQVQGTVLKEPRFYNKPWSWHLAPDSIDFFDSAAEVCDSTIVFVEEHLEEVGGSFLPHGMWCPWGSRVIEEVVPDPQGLSTLH